MLRCAHGHVFIREDLMPLQAVQEQCLEELCRTVINAEQAVTICEPYGEEPGYWFGGGNMVEDADGILYLIGRYRNPGDSRDGLHSGIRGFELALFCSTDKGKRFEKIASWTKEDLQGSMEPVLSIEGSALHCTDQGIELFVSTERARPYPAEVSSYQKPGTGIWSINVLRASRMGALKESRITEVLRSHDPASLHVKDPYCFENTHGDLYLGFCTHPYSWSSSLSGYLLRPHEADVFSSPMLDWFPRGPVWDVAITRPTCVVAVPRHGYFADVPAVALVLYDGGECMRDLQQHTSGVKRPRGYSCEELGGAGYCLQHNFEHPRRLSLLQPMFISPRHPNGTSRYASILAGHDGWYAAWQQASTTGSQPLVMHFTDNATVQSILSGMK